MTFTRLAKNLPTRISNISDWIRQKKEKVPTIRIDLSLDKYDDVVLFPDKLNKANENLKKSGFTKLEEKK